MIESVHQCTSTSLPSVETQVEASEQACEEATLKFSNKKVGNHKRMINKGTQYRLSDIQTGEGIQCRQLKVKLPMKHKQNTKKVAKVDTDLQVNKNKDHPYPDYVSEADTESDAHDSSFRLSQEEDECVTDEDISEEEDDCVFDDFADKPHPNSIFLVYWSSLLSLLNFCFTCHGPATISSFRQQGVMIEVKLRCLNKHISTWFSTPIIKRMSEGNLSLSAAVLYSGNTFTRIQEMMQVCKVAFIGRTSYHKIQKEILFPVINHVYNMHRNDIITTMKNKDALNVIGDGRCDSPGYNAKYGTYTIMNIETNSILDFSVVHIGTVANSSHMEKQGLIDCIESVEKSKLKIKTLTTDRHVQIRSYMKKSRSDIRHQFDAWHVSKNIKKKLTKIASKKNCSVLASWVGSVINHFWWCCASCEGDPVILKEKWVSLMYHIINKHTWEDATIYTKCDHPKLCKRDRLEKIWVTEGSHAYVALESIVKDKRLLTDMTYLTDFCHTGNIEVYHSLYNKFCPKRLHFSWN